MAVAMRGARPPWPARQASMLSLPLATGRRSGRRGSSSAGGGGVAGEIDVVIGSFVASFRLDTLFHSRLRVWLCMRGRATYRTYQYKWPEISAGEHTEPTEAADVVGGTEGLRAWPAGLTRVTCQLPCRGPVAVPRSVAVPRYGCRATVRNDKTPADGDRRGSGGFVPREDTAGLGEGDVGHRLSTSAEFSFHPSPTTEQRKPRRGP